MQSLADEQLQILVGEYDPLAVEFGDETLDVVLAVRTNR